MDSESRETNQEKHLLEKLYGRSITEDEWVNYAPDPDETLDEATKYIQPRLIEHAFELAAVNGIGAISASIADAKRVRTYIRNTRELIFGNAAVPFNSLEAAWDWINAETESTQGKIFGEMWTRVARRTRHALALHQILDKRLDKVFATGQKSYKYTEGDRKLLSKIAKFLDVTKLNPLVERVYNKYKGKLSQRDSRYNSTDASSLFVVADSRILENFNQRIPYEQDPAMEKFFSRYMHPSSNKATPDTYAEWMQSIGFFGMPNDFVYFAGPSDHVAGENEAHVVACTEKLILLATESRWISEHVIKGWSQGQTATYILTGIVPQIPRMRVWVEELPGNGKRAYIELIGSFNHREMRELHRIIREQTGDTGKKSLTATDVQVCDFIKEHSDKKWEDRLVLWNELNPRKQYATTSGLINLHRRATERLNRP